MDASKQTLFEYREDKCYVIYTERFFSRGMDY